ncbi:MAG: cyclase family protein [Clostridia bacterium]|nr:cyclase family protein [Clostridia bacterium]
MKIYDISQEVFSCAVFPGDIPPERKVLETIEGGSICNLTGITMCAHNGTHVDAPYHFYKDGKTIDQVDPERFIGKCYVSFVDGDVTAETAMQLLRKAKSADEDAAKRILIGGNACVTIEAARVFAAEKIFLVGNESQTVGPMSAPAQVHYELLKAEIVLLEGIRLGGVPEGVYRLFAAPLNLGGADGAPCRAVLTAEEQ